MDRAEIAKRIERAEKYLHKGKTADALEEYLHVLAVDAGNETVRQVASDLCLSLQRIPEAVKLLGELFEHQTHAGDATRASLTYKKLARFANPTWQQKVRFGQLLEESNRKLALETYENALEELNKHHLKAESAGVLKRIVLLDPSERNLLRLGELASEVGDNKTAAAAFLRLGQLAENSGTKPDQWYDRAYAQDSTHPLIILAYSKSLLSQGQVGAAIFILQPQVAAGTASAEMQEIYAKALVAANRLTEAEPLIWQMFEQNPSRLREVTNLIGLLIDAQQDSEAVALARKLEQSQRRGGGRQSFAAIMQEITAKHRSSPELLEFMGELFNASNRETDYSQTLLKLFDLYHGMGNYTKAAECLDRAAEVDAYEPGHQRRLESLRGKIDDAKYKTIASRFTGLAQWASGPVRTEEPALGGSTLQDLILQAEILVQYGMKSKAIERLQRIQELFPGEEERNEELQRLYLAVGLTPKRAEPPPPPAPAPREAPAPRPAEGADISSFTRAAEITQKLYRQTNADAVLATVVTEIGTQWKAGRCVAALRKPGLAATSLKQHCAEGIQDAEPKLLAKLLATAQELAIRNGSFTTTDATTATELEPVRDAVNALGIRSLVALTLNEGPHQMGVLLLMRSTAQAWHANDVVVLKTLSDQIVMAMNNAGLRRLVKNLSVTDEHSGLMKRASYLDLLLGETQRAVQHHNPLTVVLMQFGDRSAMVKEFGEAAVEASMQQIGQLCSTNIRQNDLAFRYEMTTIALVLGDSDSDDAILAVEKLRKLLEQVPQPGRDEAIRFHAGVAEACIRQSFDPVDIVTEVINRGEQALEEALSQGSGKVVSLSPAIASAAVA